MFSVAVSAILGRKAELYFICFAIQLQKKSLIVVQIDVSAVTWKLNTNKLIFFTSSLCSEHFFFSKPKPFNL